MSTALATKPRQKKFVLGPEHNGVQMTPEEFDAIEESNEFYRYELVHGVLVVSRLPSPFSVSPNDQLGHLLRQYRETHPQGAALDETLPERYIRTRDSRRRADRVIWAGLGRVPDEEKDTPTIGAEFVSAGKKDYIRDYEFKREEYLAANVQEYWVINCFERTLTVFRQGQPPLIVKENEVYRTPLLPGFELKIASILAAADQYRKKSPRQKKKSS